MNFGWIAFSNFYSAWTKEMQERRRRNPMSDCDCKNHEFQVCDICQNVDPNNPAMDNIPVPKDLLEEVVRDLYAFLESCRYSEILQHEALTLKNPYKVLQKLSLFVNGEGK